MNAVLRDATPADIPDLIKLHMVELPEDLLPLLGSHFLSRAIYPYFLQASEIIILVAEAEQMPRGFVIFSKNAKATTNAIRRRSICFIHVFLYGIFRHPKIIAQLWSLLRNPKTELTEGAGKIVVADAPELYVIATERLYQSRGLGSKLITEGLRRLKEFGHASCIVKTESSKALAFYQKNGFANIGAEYRGKRQLHILNWQTSTNR